MRRRRGQTHTGRLGRARKAGWTGDLPEHPPGTVVLTLCGDPKHCLDPACAIGRQNRSHHKPKRRA